MTGGGLLQRETPYLAIAAGDPDWIAAERAVIEQFADRRRSTRALLHEPRRRRPRTARRRHRGAERHWHDLLAASSEHGFGLLWVDALEGLAICAASGRCDRRSSAVGRRRRVGAQRPRLPVPVPSPRRAAVGSDEGRALSLEEATAYARRSRGERVRPAAGWAALTPTEAEVARAVADGLTNQQAASDCS